MMRPPDFHTAMLGQTGSGKTFGAQQIAASMIRRGILTLVLHKPDEHWPAASASWQTHDPARFARMYWASRNVACFMELADADVPKFSDEFRKMFTRGRHGGRHNFFLSQRAAQMHPDIRENCASLFLFSVGKNAAKLWAEEMSDERLVYAPIPPEIIPPENRTGAPLFGAMALPKRWFFYKPNRFTPAKIHTLNA